VPGSMARFLAEHECVNYRKKTIYKSIVILVPWIALSFIVYLFLFPYVSKQILDKSFLINYQYIIFVILLLEIVRLYIEKICHGISKMYILSKLSAATSLLLIIITIPLAIFYQTAEVVLIAKVVALSLPLFLVLPLLYKVINTSSTVQDVKEPDGPQIIKYGIPLSVISLAGFGYLQTDILMMAHYSDITDVAYYSICVFVFFRLTVVTRAIGNGIAPSMADKSIPDEDKNRYLYHALKYSLIISAPISFYAYFNGEEVFALVFGDAYSRLGSVIKIICWYFLITSILNVFNPVMDFVGKAKIRAYAFILGALLNVVLNIMLIPDYGLRGAAISTLIAYFLYFILVVFSIRNEIWKCFKTNDDISNYIYKVLPIVFLVMYFVMHYFDDVSYVVNAIVLISLYPFILKYFNVFEVSELSAIFKRRGNNE